MSTIIDVSSVSKSDGGVKTNTDISLTVETGGITGLIGPNGSGKTTLFNSIVGYHPIDEGLIMFEGKRSARCWSLRLPGWVCCAPFNRRGSTVR